MRTDRPPKPVVLDFACPVCKAPTGRPCVIRLRFAGPDQQSHLGRVDRYIRASNKWEVEYNHPWDDESRAHREDEP